MNPEKDLVVVVNASREGAHAPLGGIQKAIIGQIAALRAAGMAVCLLSAAYRCAEHARELGCEVDYDPRWHNVIAPLFMPSMVMRLLDLRRRRPTVILHHSGRTWPWTHLFFAGIANIAVLHREIERPYRFFRRWLALSPRYAEKLKARYRPDERLVSWAPNCLMAPPATNPDRAIRSDTAMVLGFAGRAGSGKGLDMLLQALREVSAAGVSVVLKLAGPVDSWVLEAASKYHVCDALQPQGWVEELDKFFADIDCLVLPSEKESFGLVLIEAMAAGLPVITTACNGPSSIVVDGETGIIVPIGDTLALATAITRLARDPTLARDMGRRGYERSVCHYTPKSTSGALVSSLRDLGATIRPPEQFVS